MKEKIQLGNLQKLGLSTAESIVYLNLLKKNNFTASEIAKVSGISRSKIYEILNKLIHKGLCLEILGSLKKYSPVNPDIAFDGLLLNQEQSYKKEIEVKKTIASEISESLLPFYLTEKDNTNPLDYIEIIRDKNRIVEKIRNLEYKAKYEVVSFCKSPYAMDFSNNNSEKQIHFKKDISYKGIYEIEDFSKPAFLQIIKKYQDAGEEIRIAKDLPLKLHIFDEKIVIFSLENRLTPNSSLTSMVIEHRDLAKTLKQIFDLYWETSMTLDEFIKK